MSHSSELAGFVVGASSGVDPGRAGRRSWWIYLLIGLALLFQLLVVVSTVGFLTQPGSGFSLFRSAFEGPVIAYPLNSRTKTATAHLTPPLRLISLNGEQATDVPPFGGRVFEERFGRSTWGQSNTLELEDRRGKRTTLTFPVGRPELTMVARIAAFRIVSHVSGLLYLAIGLLVWWLRPRDRAAAPLLLMGIVAMINMSLNLRHSLLSLLMGSLQMAVLPLWGLAGLSLAIQFTGSMDRRRVRQGFQWGRAIVLGTFAVALPSWILALVGATGSIALTRVLMAAGGVEVLVCVLGMVVLCWQPLRQRRSLALRKRARVLAAASVISFLFPSLSISMVALGMHSQWLEAIILVSLSLFPVFIGYAIVRHHMFDMRVMLRRGAVYGGLTLLASLSYVALVLAGLRFTSSRAPSPLFVALSGAVVVAVISLVHVRVQRAVNRLVHRRARLYARALASASAALADVRSLEAIGETVRKALIEVMRLSGVYFAVVQDEKGGRLRCESLGQEVAVGDQPGARLPEAFEVDRYEPLARSINSQKTVTTHDPQAVAAQSDGGGGDRPDVREEAAFWSHFNVEAVVPLTLGAGAPQARVVGLLVLQPMLDDRPLGLEEYEMLSTLANQLAVAVENCNALEEIKRFNEGLEQQVEARTQQLAAALDELQQAQGQLVESEMQAMLGNLVAGIVHELNSPLGTLRSSVETLKTAIGTCGPLIESYPDPGDARVAKALRSMEASGQLLEVLSGSEERIRAVLSSLGRFVNLDEAEVKPLDLKRSVSDAVTLVAPSLGAQIQVVTAFPSAAVVVPCYPARMNKVFLNLLQNAAAAVGEDGEIRVTLESVGDKVTVLFEDTGRGIPESQLANLFDLGFTTKAGGRVGMRLGLPFARRWVEEVGGQIAITSEVGKGTAARIELPSAGLV